MKLLLSLACPPYDRIFPLVCGLVKAEGINLNYLPMEADDIFAHQPAFEEFDIAESSLSSYVTLRSKGDNRFIAIPVFTSRIFRHSCVFIHKDSGIKSPQDLQGKRVGVPRYSMTAAVWLRGLFQHEYGVHPYDVRWFTGREEEHHTPTPLPPSLPSDICCESIPLDQTLSTMLEHGDLDALFTASTPSCIRKGSPQVAPLFPNSAEVEEKYFKVTNIFPIMHVITLKQTIYKSCPSVALNLYRAFCQAKDYVTERYLETGELFVTLPWLNAETKRTKRIMGEDWWPYGVIKNRSTLDIFLQYHYEQGLSIKRLGVDDLFAPETVKD